MGDGSRRFHAKSRNGCAQCKRRRVKCNMQGPICSHCKRRGDDCDYLQRSAPTVCPVSRRELATLAPNATSAPVSDILLSHYLQATSETLNLIDQSAAGVNVWQEELPPFIQTVPFLHHIILSVSALHLSYLYSVTTSRRISSTPLGVTISSRNYTTDTQDTMSPSSTVLSNHPTDSGCGITESKSPTPLTIAYANQIAASTAFRESVPTIDANNWFPVMAFVVAVLVFRLETCRRATTFSGLVTDSLAAFRTAAVAGEEIKPFFLNSGSFQLYVRRQAQNSATALDPEMIFALTRLKGLNDEREIPGIAEAEEQILCRQAIDALQRWALLVSGKPRTWLHYFWWPADVPQQFIKMIDKKRPGPLLVFVYWCTIMHQGAQRWFLDGWASKAAAIVLVEMGTGWWDPALSWPRYKLGLL